MYGRDTKSVLQGTDGEGEGEGEGERRERARLAKPVRSTADIRPLRITTRAPVGSAQPLAA